jgi:pyruvate dehydrogenase E2 component (dihydrolipoamide acetyltransferase)
MSKEIIKVPDIGDVGAVEIIEVLVEVGDTIAKDDLIVTLESDKATMEVPSETAGVVTKVMVNVGDEVTEGTDLIDIEVDSSFLRRQESQQASEDLKKNAAESGDSRHRENDAVVTPKKVVEKPMPKQVNIAPPPVVDAKTLSGKKAHASPAIRKYARELGADINIIAGTGRKGRITKADVKAFIKQAMQSGGTVNSTPTFEVLPPPNEDFSKYGKIETVALSRIQKISGKYLHRNWARIPHVTQFDESDITDLEEFRQSVKADAKAQGFGLSPLAFIVKAVAVALRKFPKFNASLDASGENLVIKKYYHIGIAVDTPNGLVVPVIRDAISKTVMEIAKEMSEISLKARDGKLTPAEMKGGCFSISSLGGIGGTAFTPIINAPEVAILGVSRSKIKPEYNKKGEVEPRLMLPLSLSYDHRVIDGADAARFIVYLSAVLSDLKKMLL